METQRINLNHLRKGICKYIDLPKLMILSTSSCNKNLCISRVECNMLITDIADEEVSVHSRFDVACQALANGSCPSALDCATDGSITDDDTRQAVSDFQRRKTAVERSNSSQGVQ